MKIFALSLALLSLMGIGFAWWGLETNSGRSYYDEMAGMIPAFVGIASIIALPISVIICYLVRR